MKRTKKLTKDMLLALMVAGCLCVLGTHNLLSAPVTETTAQADQTSPSTTTMTAPAQPSAVGQGSGGTKSTPRVGAPTRYAPNSLSRRAELHYDMMWGVDSLRVKSAESNEVIRFTYRVLDPQKAKPLNDVKNEPSLVDPKARVKLVVPSLEKVGKLRQSSTPEPGKMYWMAFSNKGRLVKPGDRVNVVIGNFQANGLVVE